MTFDPDEVRAAAKFVLSGQSRPQQWRPPTGTPPAGTVRLSIAALRTEVKNRLRSQGSHDYPPNREELAQILRERPDEFCYDAHEQCWALNFRNGLTETMSRPRS